MKKILAMALCLMFVVVLFSDSLLASERTRGLSNRKTDMSSDEQSSSASGKVALVGQQLFTRSNLRADGSTIFFHNMVLSRGDIIPVETKVIVISEGTDYLKFKVVDTGKQYKLKALSKDYERYFVKNADEIGLDKINSNFKVDVKNMLVKEGMSKEEVYISRGCPSFIGYGQKGWFYTLPQVMQSDSWWYNYNSRGKEMNVSFKDGIAVKVDRY